MLDTKRIGLIILALTIATVLISAYIRHGHKQGDESLLLSAGNGRNMTAALFADSTFKEQMIRQLHMSVVHPHGWSHRFGTHAVTFIKALPDGTESPDVSIAITRTRSDATLDDKRSELETLFSQMRQRYADFNGEIGDTALSGTDALEAKYAYTERGEGVATSAVGTFAYINGAEYAVLLTGKAPAVQKALQTYTNIINTIKIID